MSTTFFAAYQAIAIAQADEGGIPLLQERTHAALDVIYGMRIPEVIKDYVIDQVATQIARAIEQESQEDNPGAFFETTKRTILAELEPIFYAKQSGKG